MLSSHLIDLRLIVVAPLLKAMSITAEGLVVPVVFKSEAYSVSIIELAGTPPQRLRQRVGSLADYEDELRRAVDRLFTGF